jgi:hypothetical protein
MLQQLAAQHHHNQGYPSNQLMIPNGIFNPMTMNPQNQSNQQPNTQQPNNMNPMFAMQGMPGLQPPNNQTGGANNQ